MSMIDMKTDELSGAALDWAVAHAAQVWTLAHEWFPTMTLDSTFSGVQPMVYSDGQARCQLVPNNPFRQDFQIFRPTADWSQCGPLVGKFLVAMSPCLSGNFIAECFDKIRRHGERTGPTPLVAICRAVVFAKLGEVVSIPAELERTQ
ncbi:MAG: hypothetical protein CL583_01915 [Alteromonadaceae bacterium]|nr:hypothetical protein [Alteromonadaceae bacterium]|tara:strand:+ start:3044 stop:3487 length:444 start_codon:yes stop_codon:yes gene_type:complete